MGVTDKSGTHHAKRILQSRLHSLLTSLADTTAVIKKWPSSEGDNGKIHFDTTTTLIESLHKIILSLKRVEDSVFSTSTNDKKNNKEQIAELRKLLQQCQIPVDLLDLMDYGILSEMGFGLNPECFIQGLLREALRQLAGLRRRKNALTMLSAAIKSGIETREIESMNEIRSIEENASKKRPHETCSDDESESNSTKRQA